MLWCKNCNKAINEIDLTAVKEKGDHKYCWMCYRRTGRYYLLTKYNPQDKPSVEMVGLKWDIDSIRGRALEIMKRHEISLNSDEALFTLYLERFDKQVIMRIPTTIEKKEFVDEILKSNSDQETSLTFDIFMRRLKVPHTDLTSFQTLRLARQELKREAKKTGQMGIFNSVVENMREERAEEVKQRYIESQ